MFIVMAVLKMLLTGSKMGRRTTNNSLSVGLEALKRKRSDEKKDSDDDFVARDKVSTERQQKRKK